MGVLYAVYVGLTGGLFLGLLPLFLAYMGFTGRHRDHFKERLGLIPPKTLRRLGEGPRIWIHAVSLGEVRVAEAIIGELRRLLPQCSVLVSTMTQHGRRLAEERFGENIPVVYAPVDVISCFRIALRRARPDAMVFLETEIWPAWVTEARRLGIRTALINGRISVRSVQRYLRFRPFFKGILKNMDAFSMISEEDAARIRSMGAPRTRIQINGNAKYDLLGQVSDPGVGPEMRRILTISPDQAVIVAGSTRQGEEAILLDLYRELREAFPETVLIIAPRHIDRTAEIARMAQLMDLPCQLWSEIVGGNAPRTHQVVVVNTYGELFRIYSVATLVFCGASLVPLGGQNPLEPAVWGKPVLYGPSMEDFLDAKELLESAGASVPIEDPRELRERVRWLLAHPAEASAIGERGRKAVLNSKGAALAHAKVIAGLIGDHRNRSEPTRDG